jgi:hypothetical protein
LTSLIRALKIAIENFKDEGSKVKGVHSIDRMRFGRSPSSLSYLRWRISARIRN